MEPSVAPRLAPNIAPTSSNGTQGVGQQPVWTGTWATAVFASSVSFKEHGLQQAWVWIVLGLGLVVCAIIGLLFYLFLRTCVRTPPKPQSRAWVYAGVCGLVCACVFVAVWSAAIFTTVADYHGITLRQVVFTSIGGDTARVRLSNFFGSKPLKVQNAHLAVRATGASIKSGSSVPLTFKGAASVTIPPGEDATSDAAAFPVLALSEVVVSFYLPDPITAGTCHEGSGQTNYYKARDVGYWGDLQGAQTTTSYCFLTNLDVTNAAAEGALVTLGASITDYKQSTPDTNRRWTNVLAARLAAQGRTIGVLNAGISGNKLLSDGTGQSALARVNRDVLNQPNVKWVIVSDLPINDLGNTKPPPTAEDLIAGLTTLAEAVQSQGLKFICSTLTPWQGSTVFDIWTPEGEAARQAINAHIRGRDSKCDGVIDQDGATHDPANPTVYLPAYNSGDSLHPNDAGHQAIAGAIDLSLFSNSI